MDEARLQRINDIQRAIIEIYQQRYGNGVIPQKLLESLKTLYQSEPKKRKRSTRGERAAESILNSSEQTVPEGTNGDARHIDSSGSSQSVLDNAKFHARTFCPGNQPFGSQLFWFLSYCWVLRKSGLISPEDAVTVLNLTTVTQNATEYYVNAILSGVQRLHMLILRLHEEEEWPLIYAVDEISRGAPKTSYTYADLGPTAINELFEKFKPKGYGDSESDDDSSIADCIISFDPRLCFNIICDLGYNMGQLQSRVKRKRKKLSTSTEAVNWEQVSTRQQQLEWHVTILPSFKGTHTTPERVRKQAPVAAIDETSSVEISASTGEQEADLSSSQDRHETVTEDATIPHEIVRSEGSTRDVSDQTMSPPSRAVAGVNDFTPENFLLQRRQPADTSTENEEEQGGSGRTLEVNQGVSSALNSPIAPMSPDPTAPSYAVDLNDLNFEHDRSNYLSGFFLI